MLRTSMSQTMGLQLEIMFGEHGVTAEQACIMCHFSSECGGCCLKCKNDSCNGQECSQPYRDTEGARWRTWVYLVQTHDEFKHLRKYLKQLKK